MKTCLKSKGDIDHKEHVTLINSISITQYHKSWALGSVACGVSEAPDEEEDDVILFAVLGCGRLCQQPLHGEDTQIKPQT